VLHLVLVSISCGCASRSIAPLQTSAEPSIVLPACNVVVSDGGALNVHT
jgi:hypothetical protein